MFSGFDESQELLFHISILVQQKPYSFINKLVITLYWNWFKAVVSWENLSGGRYMFLFFTAVKVALEQDDVSFSVPVDLLISHQCSSVVILADLQLFRCGSNPVSLSKCRRSRIRGGHVIRKKQI